MICKNCDTHIDEQHKPEAHCVECNAPLHADCIFMCRECKATLCFGCAVKNKYKCKACYNIPQFNMEFISATMFESFLKCPNSFKHEHVLNAIPEPMRESKYSATGTLLHDLFEKYSKIRPLSDNIKTLLDEYMDTFKTIKDDLFDNEADKLVFWTKGVETITNWYKEEQNRPVPLFTEGQHFVDLHPDLPRIRVTFDRVNGVAGKVDEWEVMDYKTGKVYTSTMLDANMQLPIYALAIRAIYGSLPKTLTLYFPQHTYKNGRVKTRCFERITDDVYVCDVERGGTYSISLTQRLAQMVEIYGKIKRGEFDFNTKNEHYCQNFCALGKNQMCDGINSAWRNITGR